MIPKYCFKWTICINGNLTYKDMILFCLLFFFPLKLKTEFKNSNLQN